VRGVASASPITTPYCSHAASAETVPCNTSTKGAAAYRVELSEAFCRRQQNLLRRRPVRGTTAPWQQSLPKELKAFWAGMEDRARV
jgi:hypothetical protein